MTNQEQQFAEDMSRHFTKRLRQLIGDTGDTCAEGDLAAKTIVQILMGGMLNELVNIAEILQLDEDSFVQICRLGYRTVHRKQTRKKASP